MKISFCWQGFNGRYGKWQDGLYAAMQLIEKEHEVKYYDTTEIDQIHKFNPDWVLYWESPVTQYGKDAENWFKICSLPFKKALLFAGGPLRAIDVKDFDLVFVESQVNEDDCERQGIPYRRAFGTNTQIFQPRYTPKLYDGFMQATFAGWKRHELFAQAMGSTGALAGRRQAFDDNGYQECVKQKVQIFDETYGPGLTYLINSAHCVLNTANNEGGGQRCTLEAMACGVPVICMIDSVKNCEFIRESGGGLIVEPNAKAIKEAVETIKLNPTFYCMKGNTYIKSKWTEKHYADAILNGLHEI